MKTKKNTLLAIGEALIDFIPGQTGKHIKDVSSFHPVVGGAPANVCGAFVKLGGRARMITQLGMDPFGDKILEDFRRCGIGCEAVRQDPGRLQQHIGSGFAVKGKFPVSVFFQCHESQ